MATLTISVSALPNQPPNQSGWLSLNLLNSASHVFTLANFTTETTPEYSDPEGDALESIKITSLPDEGSLELNGVAVSVDDEITSTMLGLGQLIYVSDQSNSIGYDDQLQFTVSDVGSSSFTTTGQPVYISVGQLVVVSNEPPSIVGDGDEDLVSGESFVFTVASLTSSLDPPYADPENNPPYKLLITGLPEYGKIRFNGVIVTIGQEIPFDNLGVDTIDILNGKLIYTNEGLPTVGDDDGFTFQISDTGSQTYSG
tara:strand:- start:229 stop:996 length:768 start_codon:yes stop_codon:yes gene_type:complete